MPIKQEYLFTRVTDPDVALLLLPWFVEENCNMNRLQLGEELFNRMTDYPEDTLVLLIYYGDELRAFGVAYCRENDVKIWQAGSINLDRQVVDVGFDFIKRWAKSKGRSRITTEPNRNLKIWKRRWGFEPVSEKEVAMEV